MHEKDLGKSSAKLIATDSLDQRVSTTDSKHSAHSIWKVQPEWRNEIFL